MFVRWKEISMNKPEPGLPELGLDSSRSRQIVPARKLAGRVAQVLKAEGRDFVSAPVPSLELTMGGILGDFHAGVTRHSGGREPWYPRGTVMRNERQVSVLSAEELSVIAANLGLPRVEAGWIGGNLVVEGIPDLSFLPPRTLLFFEGGVTLRVDGYNAPCRLAGGSIARHVGARRKGGALAAAFDDTPQSEVDWTATDMALAFKDAAHMKRGLVAWVEKEGVIRPGESISARIWEQWIY
jgi:hypothetical protein